MVYCGLPECGYNKGIGICVYCLKERVLTLRVAAMAADATLSLLGGQTLPAYIEDRRAETARIVREALKETGR